VVDDVDVEDVGQETVGDVGADHRGLTVIHREDEGSLISRVYQASSLMSARSRLPAAGPWTASCRSACALGGHRIVALRVLGDR
jgi:hypothetical protein